MLLAIDVGNTRTKVYNRTRGGELFFETASIVSKDTARKVINPGVQENMVMIGASVVPCVRKFIDEASEEVNGRKPVWIDASMDLGVQIEYKSPETLGADRLANVLGAFQLCEPPFVIADLGTATKFEVVDAEGRYLGGSIMPSAKMGLKSLSKATAQLPEVEMDDRLMIIGTDTSSSILTGAVLGHDFAVSGFLKHYCALLSVDHFDLQRVGAEEWLRTHEDLKPKGVKAIITGGLSQNLRIGLQYQNGVKCRHEPQLTAIGLEAAAKKLGLVKG